jgi:hypothetical protein
LSIPSDGADFDLDQGLWVDATLIPNHAHLYKEPVTTAPGVDYAYS